MIHVVLCFPKTHIKKKSPVATNFSSEEVDAGDIWGDGWVLTYRMDSRPMKDLVSKNWWSVPEEAHLAALWLACMHMHTHIPKGSQ